MFCKTYQFNCYIVSNFYIIICRKRLIELIEEKTILFQKNFPTTSNESQLRYNFNFNQIKYIEFFRIHSIFEFRSSLLAKQITYLDAELLNRIEVKTFLYNIFLKTYNKF